MQLNELLTKIDMIDPFLPRCRKLELATGVGVGLGKALYLSQKQHWQQWLENHMRRETFGATQDSPRTAAFIYNRIMCPPMLYWLAEGVRVPDIYLDAGYTAVLAARPHPASRCVALRWIVPWKMIEYFLTNNCTI